MITEEFLKATKEYDYARDKIYMQLVNLENKEFFSDKPYRRWSNLAIYYEIVEVTRLAEDTIISFDNNREVKNEDLECWGISEDELYKQALLNMDSMKQWNPIVRFSLQEEPNVFRTVIPEKISSASYFIRDMHFLSGAACICNPEVLDKISRLYGEDFYVLPISYDEVVVMPEAAVSCREAVDLLSMKNSMSVTLTKALSDNVYLYKRETQTVEIAEAD